MKSKLDDNQKLKQLLGELHPIQVFKKYFLEGRTPDPVEMQIDPPTQLFNDILGGKITFTFAVGLHLDRYYPGALWLVKYQRLYDGQMDRIWEADRSAQFKARKRERAARKREWASVRRQFKQLCAELRRQLRAKGDR
jgi:hypothetical protein